MKPGKRKEDNPENGDSEELFQRDYNTIAEEIAQFGKSEFPF